MKSLLAAGIFLMMGTMAVGYPPPKGPTSKIHIDAKPFEEVIDLIRIGTGLNIHVRWSILEDSGVEKDTEDITT